MYWFGPLVKTLNLITMFYAIGFLKSFRKEAQLSAILFCASSFFYTFITPSFLEPFYLYPLSLLFIVLIYELTEEKLWMLYIVPFIILVSAHFGNIPFYLQQFQWAIILCNLITLATLLYKNFIKYFPLSLYLLANGFFFTEPIEYLSFIYLSNMLFILHIRIGFIHNISKSLLDFNAKLKTELDNVKQESYKIKQERDTVKTYVAAGINASTIVHEIHNTLTYTLGLIHYAKKRSTRLKSPEADLIIKDMEHVEDMIENIKDDSEEFLNTELNIETPLSRQETDLKKLTTDLCEKLFKNNPIIDYKITGPKILPINVNKIHMQRVFRNLLRNSDQAIMHAERKYGLITIDFNYTEMQGNRYLKITVTDNGCGIPKNLHNKIFDLKFSTKGKKGSGLGLYICKISIERHNGLILVHSVENVSTTFCVFLPTRYGATL